MSERKRHRDGAGKGERSWIKHDLIRQVVGAQIAVLDRRFSGTGSGKGVIIDMHAGDGEGVPIEPGPQIDLFRHPSISDATPALACRFARDCYERPEVILCETVPEKRVLLHRAYGTEARILSTNALLLRENFAGCAWAMVMNDPNGPSRHALEVLQHIARQVDRSDFVIVINESALDRIAGVNPKGDDTGPNAHMVQRMRQSAPGYAWMRDPEEWRVRLGKKHARRALMTANNQAFHGRVILVSNWIAEGVRAKFFEASS